MAGTRTMDMLSELSQRFPARVVATAGGQISFREAGSGEPVTVLLHGIGSASGSWVRQLSGLGLGRVLAWDAPGYGDSSPVEAAHPRAEDYGQRVWQWLDALGLPAGKPVTLVGHSLGSLMATAATVLAPDRVARLLLLSPAPGYGQADEAVRESKRRDRLANLHNLGPAGMADKRGTAMLSPQATPEMVAYVKSQMALVHPAGYEQATHMLAESDLASLLARVRCPVVVASGSADGITPADACEAQATRAGHPYLSLGPVGHACAVEAADAVCDLIRRTAA